MKRSKQCPKCGGTDILRVEGGVFRYTNHIYLKYSGTIPILNFVCCDCGYAEEWVNNEDLHYLKKEKEKQAKNGFLWK